MSSLKQLYYSLTVIAFAYSINRFITSPNKSEALARYQSERQPRVTYIQTTSRERSLHNSRERKDIQ